MHRPRHLRSPDRFDTIVGIGLMTASAVMLIALFLFAISYDCHWQLKLSFTTQHLCYLMGY